MKALGIKFVNLVALTPMILPRYYTFTSALGKTSNSCAELLSVLSLPRCERTLAVLLQTTRRT